MSGGQQRGTRGVRLRRAAWAAAAACACSLFAIGCARAPKPPAPARVAHGWSYEVIVAPHAERLIVSASFPAGSDERLVVLDEVRAFVRDVRVLQANGEASAPTHNGMWLAPSCARGCTIAYEFELRKAALARADRALADTLGDGIVAPLSSWMLRPYAASEGTPYRLHVQTAPSERFIAPLRRIDNDTYEGITSAGYALPLAVLGTVAAQSTSDGRIHLALPAHAMTHEEALGPWLDEATRAIDGYFGSLPAAPVMLLLEPVDGERVGFGTAMSWAGPVLEINVGRHVTKESLHRDWTLTHELVHTAFPRLADEHHWLEEGLATYVEPFARVRIGLTSEKKVWSDFVDGLPNGLPQDGDEGLDRTHTWGRTYWGGALFCLLADLEIRARTHDSKSLDDALRAVVTAGGRITVEWPIDRVIEVGDRATGTTVLRELYDRHAKRKQDVDLDALWKRLGVIPRGESVDFDEAADLSATRRAMTARR